MANKRNKVKDPKSVHAGRTTSRGQVGVGEMEAVKKISGGSYSCGAYSTSVTPGPVTVREQLTAIRGANKPNSGSYSSLRISLSSGSSQTSVIGTKSTRYPRLHPKDDTTPRLVSTAVSGCSVVAANHTNLIRLNRCYSSRGANANAYYAASAPSPLQILTTNSRRPTPASSALHLSSLQPMFSSSAASQSRTLIIEGNDVKLSLNGAAIDVPRCSSTSDEYQLKKQTMHALNFNENIQRVSTEELDADTEVALINSFNFGAVTPSKMTHHGVFKKKRQRNSPRFPRNSRKVRPSPRLCRSPSVGILYQTQHNCVQRPHNQKKTKQLSKIKSPSKAEQLKNDVNLDALMKRQKRLEKMVITLKRKPTPLCNLWKAIDEAKRVQEEITMYNDALIDEQMSKTHMLCSTPLEVNPNLAATDGPELNDTAKLLEPNTDTDTEVENLPLDSFDDLIPEEFMLDENEILGISLDNISAFGDNEMVLDFDEETRSSFPDEPSEVLAGSSEPEGVSFQVVGTSVPLELSKHRPSSDISGAANLFATEELKTSASVWSSDASQPLQNAHDFLNSKIVDLGARKQTGVPVIYNFNELSNDINAKESTSSIRSKGRRQSPKLLPSRYSSVKSPPAIFDPYASCTSSARLDSPSFLNPSPSEELTPLG